MWCKFGLATLGYPNERILRSPQCGLHSSVTLIQNPSKTPFCTSGGHPFPRYRSGKQGLDENTWEGAIQGYENAHPLNPTVGLCLGSYGGCRGVFFLIMGEVPLYGRFKWSRGCTGMPGTYAWIVCGEGLCKLVGK